MSPPVSAIGATVELGAIAMEVVRAEISGVDLRQALEALVRISAAMVFGSAIGWERGHRGAEAGFRTHILVALGCALFVIVPAQAGLSLEGLSRVVQGVASGIGFLGAGAVLKSTEEGRIHGLTTAASIWVTAGIGVACGLGREGTAAVFTLCALFVLGLPNSASRSKASRPAQEPTGKSPKRGPTVRANLTSPAPKLGTRKERSHRSNFV